MMYLKAFLVGGAICCLGQAIGDLYQHWGLTQDEASTAVSMTLVALSTFFTALGLYHKLARYAGAGTLVPITGFANAVASPAIDAKSEGWVLGVGAKIFTVAGPVLLYGTVAGAVYGVIYYFASFLPR
jgi:stage V sporulation protein AC